MIGMTTVVLRRILVAMSVLLASTSLVASQGQKPNIVLIFMDNFGWGESGA